ncbi:MAG: MBL fold metallo-hydrolase RNA specificity domain-containing protein [Flammeovirgaceae bacterium]
MKLTFWGAARQVTGSTFLLELDDDYRILIDCGMFMDNNPESKPEPLYRGALFPFDASMVNVTLLTHAHLDHSGNIPNLYRDGYEGQVLCTNPTMQLAEILLMDSAKINRKKLHKYHKRKAKGINIKPHFEPGELYVEKDVKNALDFFVPIGFNKEFKLTKTASVTFIPTGHLLGAANILIRVQENDREKTILFSGDVGRNDYPLLPDPMTNTQVDYLVCETTYGNREHQSTEDTEEELEKVIMETCIDIPGRLIIPAFSIGRTQAILYTLNKISKSKGLPPIKVYSDSPMAHSSNQVYERNLQHLNGEARAFKTEHGELFDFENLIFIEDGKASKALANHAEPCVIISSSGMMSGGRIQHHIKSNISNPYCTVFIVGYCAEGTLGRELLDGKKSLKIGKEEVTVSARILHTDAFSGHGDRNDLLRFVNCQLPAATQKVFLVHGEPQAMDDFKEDLMQIGFEHIETPEIGESFEL